MLNLPEPSMSAAWELIQATNGCYKMVENPGISFTMESTDEGFYFCTENIDEIIQADPEKASALRAKSSSLGDL